MLEIEAELPTRINEKNLSQKYQIYCNICMVQQVFL